MRSGFIALGAGVSLVVAGAVYVVTSQSRHSTDAVAAHSSAIETEAGADPATQTPAESAPEPQQPGPQQPGPSLSVLRVAPDGSGLIAGRGIGPGMVRILLAGQEVHQAQADAQGDFVAFVTIAPSDQPRRVTLEQDGIVSQDSAIIAPFEGGAPAPVAGPVAVADAAPETAPEPAPGAVPVPAPEGAPAAEAAPVAARPAEVAALDPADPVPTPDPTDGALQPSAVPVMVTSADGIALVAERPKVADTLSLDTITYDPSGDFVLGGRSLAVALRIYADGVPLRDVPVAPGGAWRASLPELDEGVHQLRVDALDAQGQVTKRIETPVRRQNPADVAALLAEQTSGADFDVAVVTVERGNSLWAIAERTYGDGIMYVQVYQENRDLIRDPDLIYPGQIFRLPVLE